MEGQKSYWKPLDQPKGFCIAVYEVSPPFVSELSVMLMTVPLGKRDFLVQSQ